MQVPKTPTRLHEFVSQQIQHVRIRRPRCPQSKVKHTFDQRLTKVLPRRIAFAVSVAVVSFLLLLLVSDVFIKSPLQ